MSSTVTKSGEGILTRFLSSSEINIDKDTRSLSFPFSSKRPVTRYLFWDDELPEGASRVFDEILSHNASDWNLERVTSGVCPYLKNHDRNQKLGQVKSVNFNGEIGSCNVKLRRTQDASDHLEDVNDGIAGGVSFGYTVGRYKVVKPAKWEYDEDKGYKVLKEKAVLEASEITLLEISSEEIPADPTVGFGGSKNDNNRVNLRSVVIDGDPNFNLEERTETMSEKNDIAESLKAQLTQSDNNCTILRSQVTSLESERTSLKSQLDTLTNEKTELVKERDSLAEKVHTLTSEVEVRNAKIAGFEKQVKVSNSYHQLRAKADELVQEAKLSAAQYQKMFGEDMASDIENLVKSNNTELDLAKIESKLELAADSAPMLNTKSALKNEPLPEQKPLTTDTVQTKVDEDSAARILRLAASSGAIM